MRRSLPNAEKVSTSLEVDTPCPWSEFVSGHYDLDQAQRALEDMATQRGSRLSLCHDGRKRTAENCGSKEYGGV